MTAKLAGGARRPWLRCRAMATTKRQMEHRRATLRPHPVRDQIVDVMRSYGKPISPTQLSRITGGTLGSVAYHVRTLTAAGVVVLADEGRVRGAVEHFYMLVLDRARRRSPTRPAPCSRSAAR